MVKDVKVLKDRDRKIRARAKICDVPIPRFPRLPGSVSCGDEWLRTLSNSATKDWRGGVQIPSCPI